MLKNLVLNPQFTTQPYSHNTTPYNDDIIEFLVVVTRVTIWRNMMSQIDFCYDVTKFEHTFMKKAQTEMLTFSLTYLLNYLLTYLLTHLHTYLLTHLLTYLLTHLLTHLHNFTLSYTLTHLYTYTLIHLHTFTFIHLYSYTIETLPPMNCDATKDQD